MRTFIEEFIFGHPVVVMQGKELLGIPCGFEMFEDGLSWADDGVMQPDCSHHPLRGPDFCPSPVRQPKVRSRME